MSKWSVSAAGFLVLGFICSGFSNPPLFSLTTPKLVVVVIVDGLPQTQLDKYFDQFIEGGFRFLREEGVWFSNARYGHSATFTAVGHSNVMTGAYAHEHGLIGNKWMDRKTGKQVYCVEDANHFYLGEPTIEAAGTSPRNLEVGTLGDKLRLATGFESRVMSVSGKDRSSILTAGRLGTAYFFSPQTGRFITSTYYMDQYPDWWTEFYSVKPQDQWFAREWQLLLPLHFYSRSALDNRSQHIDELSLGKAFPHVVNGGLDRPGGDYYGALIRTPFGDEYTLKFVRAAVQGEQLGHNAQGVPDILVVGLSSHDYVNHLFGPESRQSHDHLLRLDQALADFLVFLEKYLGIENVVMVVTADHGFSNSPEHCSEEGLDSGRIDSYQMLHELNEFLSSRYGPGQYTLSWLNPTIYLNYQWIDQKGLDRVGVEQSAVEFLLDYPGIDTVFSRGQLEDGELPDTVLGKQVGRSWHARRSGDLFLVQRPCWYLLGEPNALAATHGSPHAYDTKVPLIFLGQRFKSGTYESHARVVDIVPTIARLLRLGYPSSSKGRVLIEIFK